MKLPMAHAVVAGTLSLAVVTAAPAAAAARTGGWTTMPLPAAVARPAVLNSIAAAGQHLAWAVGTENVSGAGGPLLIHWTGRHWVKDAVPGLPRTGEMVQVSSAGRGTGWALGYRGSGAAFILHWVAGAWARATVPSDLYVQYIDGIAGGTGGDAWLWGYGPRGYALEHWIRGRWHAIKVPNRLSGDVEDMRAVGPEEVWLNDYTTTGVGIVARYKAGVWTSARPLSGGVSFTTDLLPVGDGVWITGYLCTAAEPGAGCTSSKPEIAHWNGSAWDRVLHPKGISLTTSISPGKAGRPQWAGVSASGPNEPLFYEHFNGTSWSLRPAGTQLQGADATWTAVASIPGTNATWAIVNSQRRTTEPGVTAIQFNPGTP